MKKLLYISLSLCLILVSFLPQTTYQVKAEGEDFEINEREYMERCKASDMSKKDTEICASFNEYLKNKNSQSQEELDSLNTEADAYETEIQALQAEIESISQEIESKQAEIDYATDNINSLAVSIQTKEDLLRNRLYAMQSYVNSNYFIDFILGATDFSDLFSRIQGVNTITEYDQELMRGLAKDKEESESQKVLLESSQASLTTLQASQVAKQDELNTALAAIREEIGYIEEVVTMNNATIEAVASAVSQSQISIAEEEALKQRLEEELQNSQNNPNNDTSQGGDAGGGDNSGEQTPPTNGGGSDISNGSGNTQLGAQAVLYALSQRGSPYVWGGKGQPITATLINGLASYYGWSWYQGLEPYYDSGTLAFDCSGLTSWAYAQVGISIGLSTYSQQVNGYAVSWDQMQLGDLILFDWDRDGLTDHVGLYAGDGLMVHTSTPNDGLGVHTVNLNASASWRNNCYTIRRVV